MSRHGEGAFLREHALEGVDDGLGTAGDPAEFGERAVDEQGVAGADAQFTEVGGDAVDGDGRVDGLDGVAFAHGSKGSAGDKCLVGTAAFKPLTRLRRGMNGSQRDGGRDYGSLALKVGFVLIIGVSGALVSIQAGSGPRFALLAGLAGLVLGVIVTWFVVRNLRDVMPDAPDVSDREW